MTPNKPSALVFDLDGTLVDSREDIANACNAALTSLGHPPLAYEEVLGFVGDGARALVERALARVKGASPSRAEVEEALDVFRARYVAHPCERTKLLPGARRALALGLPVGLVTNKLRDITDLVLAGLGIEGAFGAVCGGGDAPLKPAPDGVLGVLRVLGVAPADAWVVGDGPQDVEAGKRAGCTTVAVPGIAERARVMAAGPDLVVRDLDELCDLLAGVTSPPA